MLARLKPQKYGTTAALLLVCAGFAALSPDSFATLTNLVNITQQMALLAIVAFGATFVMVLGEFDLSVAAAAATLLASAVFAAASGVLVAVFAVPSFIATLAGGTIIGGMTFWASGGATLFGHAPPAFRALARGGVAGVPVLTLWMLAGFAATAGVLAETEFGRRLYAIGGNREAARLAGVPVRRDMVVAFVLSGVLSAGAGVLLAARLGSAQPTGGGGFLLSSYAAVFLGMTAFREGEPNAAGTLVGAAIIAALANGLTILDVPSFVQDMATGAIILAAVLVRRLSRQG